MPFIQPACAAFGTELSDVFRLHALPAPATPALQLLRDIPEAPQLPFSYPVAMMLATVPPV